MKYPTLAYLLGSLAILSSSVVATTPLVFAHYMLVTRPPNGDYTNDINLAKSAGIDAFVINYGGWGVDFGVQD